MSFSAVAGSGKRRKKKKHSLSVSVNPTKPSARVRKKWFPSMYVARPGALMLKISGFYNESCSAPAPAPAPATVIDYLFCFSGGPRGGLARAFFTKKQTPKTKKTSQDLTRPCPLGRRIVSSACLQYDYILEDYDAFQGASVGVRNFA